MERPDATLPIVPIWGGIECTYNRVGNQYFDQLKMSGHDRRIDDLDRFADLGIRTLRYPVLWESTAPCRPEECNWSWADERLGRLRSLEICPIVGLVHHGSGPRYTHLLDSSFAPGLEQFARRVATRYPWVDAYTPVNEPLTTARFSALYGHWYPHHRDPLAFAQALLHQCRATVLAMRAIRDIRPDAKLIQTEDLGYTHSTPDLAYQADFENERRWLSFDLLCGQVDPHHPIYAYFVWLGVPAAELDWFQDHACPPDILGINHYLTSERFLDSQVDRYPESYGGGNGWQRYADVEAVRIDGTQRKGPHQLLLETWRRYRRPVAITEAHLGCTREDQVRWLWEVWNAARRAQADGADVRAVTVWSLLGCYDWDSLVTRPQGRYETGAFDVRGPELRPTAVATLARSLATTGSANLPILAQPGWWLRSNRFLFSQTAQPSADSNEDELHSHSGCALNSPRAAPILITGGTGTLGRAFSRICEERGIAHQLVRRHELEITRRDEIVRTIEHMQPWAVINAAGYVRVDDAERERVACYRDNVRGAKLLASICKERDLPFVTFSSDLVFDGGQSSPYRESDSVNPICFYGRAKAVAERQVLKQYPRALIVRTSAFFGPWDNYNFVTLALDTLAAGQPFAAAHDAIVSPTFVPDLAHACLDLLLDGACGVWHLANQGETSWAQLACQAAERAGYDVDQIHARPAQWFGWPARRPPYSVLGSERGLLLPTLADALDRYFSLKATSDRSSPIELPTTSLA